MRSDGSVRRLNSNYKILALGNREIEQGKLRDVKDVFSEWIRQISNEPPRAWSKTLDTLEQVFAE